MKFKLSHSAVFALVAYILTVLFVDIIYFIAFFVIHCKERDKLIKYLNENEIGSIIHYPISPHLSDAYRYLGVNKGKLPTTEKIA